MKQCARARFVKDKQSFRDSAGEGKVEGFTQFEPLQHHTPPTCGSGSIMRFSQSTLNIFVSDSVRTTVILTRFPKRPFSSSMIRATCSCWIEICAALLRIPAGRVTAAEVWRSVPRSRWGFRLGSAFSFSSVCSRNTNNRCHPKMKVLIAQYATVSYVQSCDVAILLGHHFKKRLRTRTLWVRKTSQKSF